VQPEDHGTSHLCVVDAEGNVAAVTTTINLPFGARYTAAGIVMNDEMDDFARAVGEANAFGLVGGAPNLPGPGKRPVSTMSPTIVFDDAGPVLCIGAAGGSRIVTSTEQVALSVLVRGRSLADAMAAPRVHHQASPNALRVEREAPLAEATRERLRARGHVIDETDHIAIVQAIHVVRGDDAHLDAASDPRKGGAPAGE
jgi:gamma-glutamyltranspeptidase/glutathione hydrolase